MHGLLRCKINTGVHEHARGADVSLKDDTIARDGKRGYRVRVTSRTGRARRIWGDFEKVSELRWDLPREKTVGFRLLAEALGRCRTRWGGGRWKNQNRKIVPLSPYVEEPLNSKVIKSFAPELRSRKCFSCFEIPMFYLYGHSMYVSHIAISWLWYTWFPSVVKGQNWWYKYQTEDIRASFFLCHLKIRFTKVYNW